MLTETMPTAAEPFLTLPPDAVAAPAPVPVPDPSPEAERLRAAVDSVLRRGIRVPLLVRRLPVPDADGHAWTLVAGERRLTAARLAGLKACPCVCVTPSGYPALSADHPSFPPLSPDLPRSAASPGLSEKPCSQSVKPPVPPTAPDMPSSSESSVSAIAENLRAGDLNLFESAAAIAALIDTAALTQEQCAAALGVSQSYVANKLRLLRLTEEERRLMLENRLTERHGRALLRFPSPADRAPVLAAMIRREMNVAAAEEYVESLLCADARAAARRRLESEAASGPDPSPADSGRPDLTRRMLQKDTRRFTDSIEKAVDVIRRSGIPVEARRRDTPSGTLISILVPKSS